MSEQTKQTPKQQQQKLQIVNEMTMCTTSWRAHERLTDRENDLKTKVAVGQLQRLVVAKRRIDQRLAKVLLKVVHRVALLLDKRDFPVRLGDIAETTTRTTKKCVCCSETRCVNASTDTHTHTEQ